MNYREFKNIDKTFVVIHNNGFGSQESPIIEMDVVYETNDFIEAENMAKTLQTKNNDDNGWNYNTYDIGINTLTTEGNKLLQEFLNQHRDDKKYYHFVDGGKKVYVEKCDEYDFPKI